MSEIKSLTECIEMLEWGVRDLKLAPSNDPHFVAGGMKTEQALIWLQAIEAAEDA